MDNSERSVLAHEMMKGSVMERRNPKEICQANA
jgi:hypothetical protein